MLSHLADVGVTQMGSPQSPTARGDVSSYFDMMDRGSGGSAAQQKALSVAATPQRSVQSTPSVQRNQLLATPVAGHHLAQASPQATPRRQVNKLTTAHSVVLLLIIGCFVGCYRYRIYFA